LGSVVPDPTLVGLGVVALDPILWSLTQFSASTFQLWPYFLLRDSNLALLDPSSFCSFI